MTPDHGLPCTLWRALRHLLVLVACVLMWACGGGDPGSPAGGSDGTSQAADSGIGSAGAGSDNGAVAGGVGSGGTGLGGGGTDVAGGVGSGGTGTGSGSDMAGGVGSGGSGLAEGGVSGYGSLIVDGRSYDDSQAKVWREKPGGGFEQVTIGTAIGQQVRLTLSSPSSTTVTRVEQSIGIKKRIALTQIKMILSFFISDIFTKP